jgi:hypothetical protein
MLRVSASGSAPVFELVYFARTMAGDIESPILTEIVNRLASDFQREYIESAFRELEEQIRRAFFAGLPARAVSVTFDYDLFLGWRYIAHGLHPQRGIPFTSISDFGAYVTDRFKLEPIQGASRADVLSTTSPHL